MKIQSLKWQNLQGVAEIYPIFLIYCQKLIIISLSVNLDLSQIGYRTERQSFAYKIKISRMKLVPVMPDTNMMA